MDNLKLAYDAASIVADALGTENLDFEALKSYCKKAFPKDLA